MIVLQQYLPFTVLKPAFQGKPTAPTAVVATVLTVYGIETLVVGTAKR